MADLIDRKSAIDEAYAVIVDDAVYDVVQVETLEGLPSVDAVEIVRCKDCKHNSLNRVSGNVFCDLGIGLSQIYDFCSRGERKDD